MNTEISSKKNTLAKEERLCSTKSIDKLFSSGESFIAYPLRIVYFIEDEADIGNQIASILVSVSKKKFKRAVKRNRVKRLVKEAYRLNKGVFQDLLRSEGKRVDIAFLYLKNELPAYAEIEKAILKTVAVLSERLKGGKL
ncbi:MAG: ribonuclease P protein component [Prevotella sp.]|jgi:ribonuclease P protein component|nr:ribonuclease P protein component [Prevotella sp.]